MLDVKPDDAIKLISSGGLVYPVPKEAVGNPLERPPLTGLR